MTAKRPIIGCTTYRKRITQAKPIDIYGLMPSYTEAIAAAGGIPVLIPLGLSDGDLRAIFERVDGILVPGGGDVAPESYHGQLHVKMSGVDRERDRTEFYLTRTATAQQKPLLAICRGIQVLNVALGGTLWEDIPSLLPNSLEHDTLDKEPRNYLAHSVSVKPDSLLARTLGKTESWVNSFHHQAVHDVAPELAVTATSSDGLVEAVEVPGHRFALGVQWHPENLVADDPAMLALFIGLVQAASTEG